MTINWPNLSLAAGSLSYATTSGGELIAATGLTAEITNSPYWTECNAFVALHFALWLWQPHHPSQEIWR